MPAPNPVRSDKRENRVAGRWRRQLAPAAGGAARLGVLLLAAATGQHSRKAASATTQPMNSPNSQNFLLAGDSCGEWWKTRRQGATLARERASYNIMSPTLLDRIAVVYVPLREGEGRLSFVKGPTTSRNNSSPQPHAGKGTMNPVNQSAHHRRRPRARQSAEAISRGRGLSRRRRLRP